MVPYGLPCLYRIAARLETELLRPGGPVAPGLAHRTTNMNHGIMPCLMRPAAARLASRARCCSACTTGTVFQVASDGFARFGLFVPGPLRVSEARRTAMAFSQRHQSRVHSEAGWRADSMGSKYSTLQCLACRGCRLAGLCNLNLVLK